MSTGSRIPIVKLYDTLIVPIHVSLTEEMVPVLKDDIAERLKEHNATALVIELSGVDILDSFLSRSIRDIAFMARLLGVRAVICGFDPATAVTLVEMDLEIQGIPTALNLEAALELLVSSSELEDPICPGFVGDAGCNG